MSKPFTIAPHASPRPGPNAKRDARVFSATLFALFADCRVASHSYIEVLAEDFFVDSLDPSGSFFHREVIHHSLAGARAHSLGLLGVGEDPADGVGQGWSIVHGDQNPGLPIFDYFGDAATVNSNHRLACCHAFDDYLAQR